VPYNLDQLIADATRLRERIGDGEGRVEIVGASWNVYSKITLRVSQTDVDLYDIHTFSVVQ
jgi:membrane protein implicated in regulation of membrane protease activity